MHWCTIIIYIWNHLRLLIMPCSLVRRICNWGLRAMFLHCRILYIPMNRVLILQSVIWSRTIIQRLWTNAQRLSYQHLQHSTIPHLRLSESINYSLLSRIRGCVTNNNGFWIWWLGLLAVLYNYTQLWHLSINDCLRLALFLAGLRVSSILRDRLGSDLWVGHVFIFHCPLVNTPQLNTLLLNWFLNSLTTESLE
jgi:hypothetical protein